jgi:predicted type IV restriction endonuclease
MNIVYYPEEKKYEVSNVSSRHQRQLFVNNRLTVSLKILKNANLKQTIKMCTNLCKDKNSK